MWIKYAHFRDMETEAQMGNAACPGHRGTRVNPPTFLLTIVRQTFSLGNKEVEGGQMGGARKDKNLEAPRSSGFKTEAQTRSASTMGRSRPRAPTRNILSDSEGRRSPREWHVSLLPTCGCHMQSKGKQQATNVFALSAAEFGASRSKWRGQGFPTFQIHKDSGPRR